MGRVSWARLFGADPSLDNLHRFETSWLLSPTALAGVRALTTLYIFTTIIVVWAWYGAHDHTSDIGQSFSYFTWLTYWGLGFYHLVATIHTVLYARTGRSVLLDRWPRFFRVMHIMFYATITTFPFLVTIVFWGILFKPPFYKEIFPASSYCCRYYNYDYDYDYSPFIPDREPISTQSIFFFHPLLTFLTNPHQISQHGLNSLHALVEIILPATAPHPWMAIPVLIVLLLLYVSVAYITHATEGFYTYSFLDTGVNGSKSGIVTGYCFGILAAIVIIFLVSWGLIRLRVYLTGDRIKRAARDPLRRGQHEFGHATSLRDSSIEMKQASAA
ncbi:hypothetical protein POX_b03326 [Penicillium oxalicum]|uniref:hypothetical protein n=1 Tax=Penicillium oxalicum TaxID=69781 RepID=UPI0020B89B24|nr:hypothetical protein POX_b03326 [Penicillium oxalicum]KAI2793273.1 hypothetical protein POX_b03326 [Penicillium oxalicum]